MKLVDYQCPICGAILEDMECEGFDYFCESGHPRTKMNRMFGYAMLKVGIRKSLILGSKAKGRFTKYMPTAQEAAALQKEN